MSQGIIFDLDGTLYQGRMAVPGAAAFVRDLRARDWSVLFMTNRANRSPATVARHLRILGIPCRRREVLTSAEAAANLLAPGRVFAVGELPMLKELRKAGLVVTDKDVDTVLVGFDAGFNYKKLEKAVNLILAGARFAATNPDKILRTDNGWRPGTGAIVAAVETAVGTAPLIIGKPEGLMVGMALQRMGLKREDVIMAGDNLETDIAAAVSAGVRSVLMLTGVSSRDDLGSSSVKPTWIAADFRELTDMLNSGVLENQGDDDSMDPGR